MPSILFVCTANRFRSPIASLYFAREVVRHRDDKDLRISSAGTWTKPGEPATAKAIQLANNYDLNLGLHKSRMLNHDLMNQADLVLVMEAGNKEAITHEFPSAVNRIFLLTEAVGQPPTDIPDPYATNESAQRVAKEIVDLIDGGYNKIIDLAWEKMKLRQDKTR